MTEPTKEQINKLPKWAQDYIESILLERYEAQRQMEDAQQMFSKGDSKQTWTANGNTTELDMPISRVRFYVDRTTYQYIDVEFDHHQPRAISVRGINRLKISPEGSNRISVEVE